MAQADIIREFLVQLGFKTDEKSLKKFKEGVEGATVAVGKLVAGIAGAALTVSAGVAAFAANMEALYFSVQKVGSSATSVKAFEKSMANFGVSAGEAMQSVQSLARWMRETPESEGFLQGLGVKTRDANGNLKETTDIMVDLGRVLKEMNNYPLARQYGSMLGLSEDAQRALMNGDFAAALEKQRALLKDAGYEGATRKAHEFGIKLRELQTRVETVATSIGSDLLEALGPDMDAATKWFSDNSKEISENVASAGKAIIAFGALVLPALGLVADGWKNIWQWVKFAGEEINKVLPQSWNDKIGKWSAQIAAFYGSEEAKEALRINEGGPADTKSPAKPKAGALDPVAFFTGLGWTKDQSAGIVANLKHESGMNPGATGDNGQAYGLAQWHPDRQANFAKWAGKDIRQSTAEEQMGFVNYELTKGAEQKAGMLLRASNSAEMAGHVMSKYYERPANGVAEASARGASAVQIAQTTTINVNGGDAAATGRAVAGEQGRVNQNLSRDLSLAFN